jgi:hypothetical protein
MEEAEQNFVGCVNIVRAKDDAEIRMPRCLTDEEEFQAWKE